MQPVPKRIGCCNAETGEKPNPNKISKTTMLKLTKITTWWIVKSINGKTPENCLSQTTQWNYAHVNVKVEIKKNMYFVNDTTFRLKTADILVDFSIHWLVRVAFGKIDRLHLVWSTLKRICVNNSSCYARYPNAKSIYPWTYEENRTSGEKRLISAHLAANSSELGFSWVITRDNNGRRLFHHCA